MQHTSLLLSLPLYHAECLLLCIETHTHLPQPQPRQTPLAQHSSKCCVGEVAVLWVRLHGCVHTCNNFTHTSACFEAHVCVQCSAVSAVKNSHSQGGQGATVTHTSLAAHHLHLHHHPSPIPLTPLPPPLTQHPHHPSSPGSCTLISTTSLMPSSITRNSWRGTFCKGGCRRGWVGGWVQQWTSADRCCFEHTQMLSTMKALDLFIIVALNSTHTRDQDVGLLLLVRSLPAAQAHHPGWPLCS